jgi:hypothetical protein
MTNTNSPGVEVSPSTGTTSVLRIGIFDQSICKIQIEAIFAENSRRRGGFGVVRRGMGSVDRFLFLVGSLLRMLTWNLVGSSSSNLHCIIHIIKFVSYLAKEELKGKT